MRGKKKREEALDRDRIKGESRRARERVTGRQTGRETKRTEKERFTSIIIIFFLFITTFPTILHFCLYYNYTKE